jgi:hypothetical protein
MRHNSTSEETLMTKTEHELRRYAEHLALIMRGPVGGPWILSKRYGDKKPVSRSISRLPNVERAIIRWGDAIKNNTAKNWEWKPPRSGNARKEADMTTNLRRRLRGVEQII